MEELEQAGFGRVDSSNFGLWLNIDPVVNSSLGPELASLTLSSFHFALRDEHREIVERSKAEDLTFLLHCFTMFAHERRHFHDLLATPYGSMLMRQYTRINLLSLVCQHDLVFRSDAIAIPLSDWVSHAEMFQLVHNVPPPSDNLRQLHKAFSVMQEKLDVFNEGTTSLPAPFTGVDATAILEGLAILTQEHELVKNFGPERVKAFRDAFQHPKAELKYYGAIALCAAVLGRNIPTEFLGYCLLSSLCGNFQDPNPATPRYPTDLLINLLLWLRNNCPVAAINSFAEFADYVDGFFEQTYGDDVQGLVIKAAKVNEQVSLAFSQMVEQHENAFGDSLSRRVLDLFENFRKVQAAFAANVIMDPLWYVGSTYLESTAALPTPVIFLECKSGLPVDSSLEDLYYIQTESRINLAEFPAETFQEFKHLTDHEGVVRAAHILSPRAKRFQGPTGKYPIRFQFEVPEIDVQLWQEVFDNARGTLRFLLDGREGMIEPLFKTMLVGFGIVGVKVYDRSGELSAPPIPEDVNDPGIDPAIRKFLADTKFRDALKNLRAHRRSSAHRNQ